MLDFIVLAVELFFVVVFCFSACLFALKIIWNLAVPYAVIRKRSTESQKKGVLMFPLIEIGLLSVATSIVLVLEIAFKMHQLQVRDIASIGMLLIVGSYIHLVVVLFLSGLIASLK